MSNLETKLAALCAIIEQQQRNRYAEQYPGPNLTARADNSCKTHYHLGKKWARVDVGTSGKYMVEMTTEEIVGIKAYGVPHLGHRYGTLDTIDQWDWSGYVARSVAPATYSQHSIA